MRFKINERGLETRILAVDDGKGKKTGPFLCQKKSYRHQKCNLDLSLICIKMIWRQGMPVLLFRVC